jgi:mannose/fructose/sorbose-specific phosphotransferase system IIA component
MKIIIVSHGNLAQNMLEAAEMFLGKEENVIAAGLYEGDSPEDFEETLLELIGRDDEQVLFICDIKSGTPFNAACRLTLGRPNIGVLYGMNLAMVLECMTSCVEMDTHSLVDYVVDLMPKTYGALRHDTQ